MNLKEEVIANHKKSLLPDSMPAIGDTITADMAIGYFKRLGYHVLCRKVIRNKHKYKDWEFNTNFSDLSAEENLKHGLIKIYG
jgi:hypothetical protein